MLLFTLVVLSILMSFGDIKVVGSDTSEEIGFTEESDATGHDYGTTRGVNTTDDYVSQGSIAEQDTISSERSSEDSSGEYDDYIIAEEYDDYNSSEEYDDYHSSEESIEDDVNSEESAEYGILMKKIVKSCFPMGMIPGFPMGGFPGFPMGGGGGGFPGAPYRQQPNKPQRTEAQKSQNQRLSSMTAAPTACSDFYKKFWTEYGKMVKSGEVQRCGRQKCSFSDVMKVRSVVPMSPECQEQGIMFYKGEM